MPRGRPPKPIAAHLADGTFRASRHDINGPKPPPGVPDRPDHLTPYAVDAWQWLVDVLGTTGVLTMADRNVMTLYCEAYADWRTAKELIEESGLILQDDEGRCYKNPARVVLNEAVAQMQSLGASLGLNPAARTNLKVIPPRPVDNNKARFFKAREQAAG